MASCHFENFGFVILGEYNSSNLTNQLVGFVYVHLWKTKTA